MPDAIQTMLREILSQVGTASYVGMFDVGGPYPEQGQFVIRGTTFGVDPIQRLGYVTQIRVGRGQFKSDMYFLRLCNGELITCENDCYIPMSDDQVKMARSVFTLLPEDEGFDSDPEYFDCQKIGERGFIVKNSKTFHKYLIAIYMHCLLCLF